MWPEASRQSTCASPRLRQARAEIMAKNVSSGRWRTLLKLSDAALIDHLVRMVQHEQKRLATHKQWAAWAGLPEGEVSASPFGARMIAVGLQQGATTVLHEQRPLVHLGKATQTLGLTDDPLHGTWSHGVLRTGKYQEFCQEDPFCAYHPEHSSKWAPHEWLHRAVGFFHTASASAFERYVGARLNELLPVATWYGLEHFLRLDREGPFDRIREGKDLTADLDRCLWRTLSKASLKGRVRASLDLVRWTLQRTHDELACIDREINTGDLVPAIDAQASAFDKVALDASSDALAYIAAHTRRLESEPVSAVLHALAHHRHATIASLRAQIDTTLDQLLFDSLELNEKEVLARRDANALHDLYLRAATTGGRAWTALAPSLDQARNLREKRLAGSAEQADIRTFCESTAKPLGRHASLATLGLPAWGPFSALLYEGLRASFPATLTQLADTSEEAEALASLPPSRTSLHTRLDTLLRKQRQAPALRVLLRFEQALLMSTLAHEPRRHLVSDAPNDQLRVGQDARCAISLFAINILDAHRGEPLRETQVGVALRHDSEGISLIELPHAVASAILRAKGTAHTRDGYARRLGGEQIVDELLSLGVLIGYRI